MAFPRGPLEPFKFASPLRVLVSLDENGSPKLPVELESRLSILEKQCSLPSQQKIAFLCCLNKVSKLE